MKRIILRGQLRTILYNLFHIKKKHCINRNRLLAYIVNKSNICEELMLKEKKLQIAGKYVKEAIFCTMALFVVAAIGKYAYTSGNITVSNSIDGRELPIYCVETNEKNVALSFDAAWGNEDITQILEILEKHNIHATFFMTGGWIEAYPDDVKKIYEKGHDLGNHGENHKNMSQLSDSECQDELMKAHSRIKELTGCEMYLFRPPYGDYDSDVIKSARECGYYTIQWDVDTWVVKIKKGEPFFFCCQNAVLEDANGAK